MWGRVPSIPVMAITAMAPLIKTRAQQLQDESILLQELLPIVLACAVWGQDWQGSWVVVCCDNMGAVAVVNSGYSKVPQIMHLAVHFIIQDLALECMTTLTYGNCTGPHSWLHILWLTMPVHCPELLRLLVGAVAVAQ